MNKVFLVILLGSHFGPSLLIFSSFMTLTGVDTPDMTFVTVLMFFFLAFTIDWLASESVSDSFLLFWNNDNGLWKKNKIKFVVLKIFLEEKKWILLTDLLSKPVSQTYSLLYCLFLNHYTVSFPWTEIHCNTEFWHLLKFVYKLFLCFPLSRCFLLDYYVYFQWRVGKISGRKKKRKN